MTSVQTSPTVPVAGHAFSDQQEELRQVNDALEQRLADLEAAHRSLKDARRATLNLLDDVRESEATLRASEERLRAVTSIVPDLLWCSEPDGRMTWHNQRWLDYTGQSSEERVAWGWTTVIHANDRDKLVQQYRTAVAESQSLQLEGRMRNAAGVYRWFLIRAEPLRDPGGGVVRMYGAATDIHDLKLAEERLRKADTRKNEFLALLGHELRNPLAAIRGGVQLMGAEKAKPGSKAAALPLVAEQVAHMERLIDDLLDLTRIVQGRLQVRKSPLVLQNVLRQAIDMTRSNPESAGFEIISNLPEGPVTMTGDRERLVQVYSNILCNAVRYSGASRRIEVTLSVEHAMAVTRVKDFGVGISADILPRIFDSFVQARPGVTLGAGLGMGLAVVRQLVHAHGGEVLARSAGEGGGSEFEVRLPIESPRAS